MKNGFTLVELSIVIVIIGLLVGGVLVGQSLIESAKLNAQIRQFQQLAIGYQLFTGKFKKYPGDANFFEAPGDNDNIMENDMAANTSGGPASTEERANFWKHLGDSKILPDTYGNDDLSTGAANQAGLNMPQNEINDIVGLSTWINASALHFITTRDDDSDAAPAAITPAQALAIDVKLDDGISTYAAGNNVASVFSGVDCESLGQYNVSNSERACTIAVRFGVISGVDDSVN